MIVPSVFHFFLPLRFVPRYVVRVWEGRPRRGTRSAAQPRRPFVLGRPLPHSSQVRHHRPHLVRWGIDLLGHTHVFSHEWQGSAGISTVEPPSSIRAVQQVGSDPWRSKQIWWERHDGGGRFQADRAPHPKDVLMIFIVVKFTVCPEYRDTWLDRVSEFTEGTRAEPGSLWFEWSRNADNPDEFVLLEAFRDGEA